MTVSEDHEKLFSAIKIVDGRVSEVSDKLDHVVSDLEFHVAESHESYVGRVELASFVKTMEEWIAESRLDGKSLRAAQHASDEQQHRLADVLLGEQYVDYDGEITRRGGIKQIVDAYDKNAGFKVSVPWGQIVTILVAVIAAVSAIVVAVIQMG